MKGINIFSGSKDELGRALTNPTHYNPKNENAVSIKRGGLGKYYFLSEGIVYKDIQYKDVEEAYYSLRKIGGVNKENKQLLINLIVCKFKKYPVLLQDIDKLGGVNFLKKCIHTYNKYDDPDTFDVIKEGSLWTSNGGNAFINCLVEAYRIINLKSII